MSDRKYEKKNRGWLNEDPSLRAHYMWDIDVSVSGKIDNYGNISANFSIGDCNRVITLDFYCYGILEEFIDDLNVLSTYDNKTFEQEFDARMAKLDLLINQLNDFRSEMLRGKQFILQISREKNKTQKIVKKKKAAKKKKVVKKTI